MDNPVESVNDYTVSDAIIDIADAPDELKGINPGNIYIDNQSIKEDTNNPYSVLFSS